VRDSGHGPGGFAVADAKTDSNRQVGVCGSLLTSTAETNMQLPTRTVERFSGDVKKVKAELEQAADEHDVFLVCQSEAEIQRLTEVFDDSRLREEERLHFVTGRLTAGFHLIDEKALLLGGNELFRRTDLRRKVRKRAGKKIDSFLDLRNGDLVVHLVHGIGRYRGLERLKRENQVEDHLKIEFNGGTCVYVPATKIDLVQKYVGASKTRPRLATIGGALWQKRRKAAELAVTDMASELLEVQAKRAARPGIAFLPDTEWQREFDALFPYQETDDQLLAIDSIKEDMQKGTPMDRLLCGDVGFGKTEVSVRAAFKAVDNGYQVAVLVPTTILAEQHYRSFKERMAEFPFEIARLSRFCSRSEEREIVEGLKEGRIDIVIGTHRLASKDVSFHNLGLLVIDEEQRFGVQVKERLKSLKSTVDVLTMTATPIPRTLHMAMTGMRDISNLHTPPEERVAVETRISRWNNELIRTAILRELNRGGQVFIVHNRVNDIDRIRKKLEEIVPEATIRVGHGQMHEDDLEEVMVGFVEHEYDILLATTIVESGLDIPNANTIFVDQADMYGLSDLHQLRGRVGRYKHRAFCYLLIDEHKHITPEASRRLRAIEEFSQMGAGFAIAMRDLEFRGAGNVLGTQQSGHIAAIGYELYCELLESAVRHLKRLPPKMKVDVNIDLPGEALLPDDYVPDLLMKIDIYRRLSRVSSPDELVSIREEMSDRFGRPPEEVLHLLALAELRIDAAVWQIEIIRLEEQDGDFVVLEYVDRGRIKQLAKMSEGRLRVVDDRCAYIPLSCDIKDAPAVLAATKSVLQPS
ncbi:MAG: transcription-repair coupling factor, partial [Planctomycetota bacterium]